MVEMMKVKSANVHSTGSEGNKLFVRFRNRKRPDEGGPLYSYTHKDGVSSLAHHAELIRDAESPTAHLNLHVKGPKHPFNREDDGL